MCSAKKWKKFMRKFSEPLEIGGDVTHIIGTGPIGLDLCSGSKEPR